MAYKLLLAVVLAAETHVSRANNAAFAAVSPSEWTALNKSVGGRLHPGIPYAASCYEKYKGKPNPHQNPAQCAAAEAGHTDAQYLATQFGAYQNYQWGTCQATAQGCNLDPHSVVDPAPLQGNCQQGSISNMYIEVQSVQDIKQGLAFAHKHKVPLVIKNSGHDYKGRSSAPKSLALWMKNYKPVMKFETNFTPAGCSEAVGNVVTFSSGYDFEELNNFGSLHDAAIVSGSSTTVGPAGGWLAGGGHSPLSPAYGLGVDNVYQMRAVLPNGKYITASRCENPDLFFAMRGGGGSTFAVVTEVSQLAHPSTQYQFAQFTFLSMNSSVSKQFLKICIENAETWANDGWGGYSFPENQASLFFAVTPKLSLLEAQNSMKPLFDFASQLPSDKIGTATVTTFASYDEIYAVLAAGIETESGYSPALASRIIPVENFRGAKNQDQLLNAMYPIASVFGPGQTQPLFICITAPYAYKPGRLVAPSSVTPAWRTGLWHVIGVNTFNNTASPAAIRQAYRAVSAALDPLRAITPGSGAYQNEADTFEPDPIGAYWGQANYAKLMRIKKEVDPSNILTCHDCVGWNAGDNRYGCYPQL